MSRKIAVFALDSDRVSDIALSRLFTYYLPKKYHVVVYSEHRVHRLPRGVVQKRISFSKINISWIINNLSENEYKLLFVSHASLKNTFLKLKIMIFRRKKIRIVNFSGDYYSPKDFQNIVIQNACLLVSTDEYDDQADTVFLIGRQRKLVAKILPFLFLVPSLVFTLPSLLEMFVFLKKNKQ